MKLKPFVVGVCAVLGLGLVGTLTYAGASGMLTPQTSISQGVEENSTQKENEQLKSTLAQFQATLKQKEEELAQKDEALQQKESLIQAKISEIEKQTSRAETAEAELSTLTEQKAQLEQERSALKASIEKIKAQFLQDLKINVEQFNTQKMDFEVVGNDVLFLAYVDVNGKVNALWYYDTLNLEMHFLENYERDRVPYLMPLEKGCIVTGGKSSKFYDPVTHQLYYVGSGSVGKSLAECASGCVMKVGRNVVYFDYTTKTATSSRFYADSMREDTFIHKIDNGCLICTSSNGIQFFNESTKEYTKLYDRGSYYSCFLDTPVGCLITGEGNGVLFYDNSNGTITQLTAETGFKQNGASEVRAVALSHGVVLKSEKMSMNDMFVYFDYTTKELTTISQAQTTTHVAFSSEVVMEHGDDIYLCLDKGDGNFIIAKFNTQTKSYTEAKDLGSNPLNEVYAQTDLGFYYTSGQHDHIYFHKFSDDTTRTITTSYLSDKEKTIFIESDDYDFFIHAYYSHRGIHIYKIDHAGMDVVRDEFFSVSYVNSLKSAKLVDNSIYIILEADDNNYMAPVIYDIAAGEVQDIPLATSCIFADYLDETNIINVVSTGGPGFNINIYNLLTKSNEQIAFYHGGDYDYTSPDFDMVKDKIVSKKVEDGMLLRMGNFTFKVTTDHKVILQSITL